jgi:bacterioferritin-associated ferredoxin
MADKAFVCLCLDVTEADLDRAVAEGFTDAETLKRYTACFMGPCQGKACMDTVLDLLAQRLGVDVDELRRPTLRPPAHPVRLGLLAGLGGPDADA